jgi:uncharacterized protein YjbI with pentapeptide repeats
MAAKPPPDTRDLDATLAALNRSAERLQTLWFSFLALTLYFAISTLTVTHLQLLLEEPQTLPILQIKVPLLPFFAIAPAFYLIIHVYMLMMLVLLARSASGFEAILAKAIPGTAKQEQYRLRAENALFLQLLVGAESERRGRNGLLLSAVALVTLALAPVLVLLLFQLIFLPYHHFALTWWHRALVATDVLAVLFLWSAYRRGDGVVRTPAERNPLRWSPSALAHGFAALLALHVSVNIGRWAGEPPLRDCFRNSTDAAKVPGHACLYDDRIGDYAATENGILFGLFQDRLKLANRTIVGQKLFEEKQAEGKAGGGDRFVPTRDFSERNFTAGKFDESDIRGVDLRDAVGWRLTGERAQLQYALLTGARFQRSIFSGSQFQRAKLEHARMHFAVFDRALFQEARFDFAHLAGTSFHYAQLQGASLRQVQLQGASLNDAEFQGAELFAVKLNGASLYGARLEGASLARAELIAASLQNASLAGASLTYAQILSVSMQGAFFRGTDMSNANVFRSEPPTPEPTKSNTSAINYSTSFRSSRFRSEKLQDSHVLDWQSEFYISSRFKNVDKTINLYNFLLPSKNIDVDLNISRKWFDVQKSNKNYNRFILARNDEWVTISCSSSNGQFVARALVNRYYSDVSIADFVQFFDKLHEGRTSPAACPGVKGFTAADWERLDELRARAARQAAGSKVE